MNSKSEVLPTRENSPQYHIANVSEIIKKNRGSFNPHSHLVLTEKSREKFAT